MVELADVVQQRPGAQRRQEAVVLADARTEREREHRDVRRVEERVLVVVAQRRQLEHRVAVGEHVVDERADHAVDARRADTAVVLEQDVGLAEQRQRVAHRLTRALVGPVTLVLIDGGRHHLDAREGDVREVRLGNQRGDSAGILGLLGIGREDPGSARELVTC